MSKSSSTIFSGKYLLRTINPASLLRSASLISTVFIAIILSPSWFPGASVHGQSRPLGLVCQSPYTQNVERLVKKHWSPPAERAPFSVGVIFKVLPNGRVTDLRITKPSGLDKADDAALRAVTQAAPFPKLPEGSPDFMEMEFTLNYEVNTDKLRGENDPKEKPQTKKKPNTQLKSKSPKSAK